MWAGELFGLSDEVGFPALPGDPGVVVAGTEVVVGGVGIGEQMPDDGEDGVAHSDDGAAFAAAPGDALVALGQECGGTCRPETISPRVAPKPWFALPVDALLFLPVELLFAARSASAVFQYRTFKCCPLTLKLGGRVHQDFGGSLGTSGESRRGERTDHRMGELDRGGARVGEP